MQVTTNCFGMGWVDDPASVLEVCLAMPRPTFAEAAGHLLALEPPAEVFLWKACEKVTGRLLPPRNQGQVGSCVSFGTGSAVEHLVCVEIANGDMEEYRDVCQEVIYAGSRVEVGGGRLGNGDGSLGAWAADFVRRWGIVPRGQIGSYDLSRYDEARCRSWGRSGVPSDLETEAKKHPVKQTALVRSWNEAVASLANGYPIAVCSQVGFEQQTRDQDGFVKPRGNWPHCMALLGYTKGRRPGGFILNSWGESPTMLPPGQAGPIGIGNHSPAGFWVDADVVDGMLRQGDSWAFSSFSGFPARLLNWVI